MEPPQSPRPDPSAIVALATVYRSSTVLLSANRLGVFTALARGARAAVEVAVTTPWNVDR